MASRRESRTCAAQNDALMEFENFKKKYLLVNKHVTKLNSTLSVRIEELNGQISKLQVENLRLRSANLSLAAQLKRERGGKGRDARTAALIDTATAEALRQLNIIRDAILTGSRSPASSPHSIPTPQSSSPATAPTRITGPVHPTQSTRIAVARAPEFTSLVETSETPHRRRSSGAGTECSDSEMEPLARLATRRPVPGAYRVAAPVNMDLEPEPEPKVRRPARRQSGLLARSSAVAVPEFEDDPGFETNPENEVYETLVAKSKSKPSSVSSASSSDSKRVKRKLVESEPDDAIKSVGAIVDVRDENELGVKGENLVHKPAQARAIASTTKLQDVTNSPRRPAVLSLNEKEKVIDDPVPMSYIGTPAVNKTKPRSRTLIPTPTSGSGRLTPIPGADEDEIAPGGRERRARKSVNYAEPKLNTKMRKPTPDATSYGPRISLPAPKPRSSSSTARDPSPPPDSPMPALIDPLPKSESAGSGSTKSDTGSTDAAVTMRTARRRRAVPSSWALEDEEAEDEDADDEYVPHSGGVRRKSSTKAGERRHSSAV
ncbi:hypothetical protein RhiJN_14936 [Ceratobasidium sp. AG-Ba]|nr:hypothetical protein RhiJN_14936 [Ceratobasidium sp. AG-Ba]QRW15475.1 hypothetical protein RhiLY_14474 [Ceratobasidium sp. AG-Ba]